MRIHCFYVKVVLLFGNSDHSAEAEERTLRRNHEPVDCFQRFRPDFRRWRTNRQQAWKSYNHRIYSRWRNSLFCHRLQFPVLLVDPRGDSNAPFHHTVVGVCLGFRSCVWLDWSSNRQHSTQKTSKVAQRLANRKEQEMLVAVSISRIRLGLSREYFSGSWLAITNSQKINARNPSQAMIKKAFITLRIA